MKLATALAVLTFLALVTRTGHAQCVPGNEKEREIQRLRLLAVETITEVASEAPLWNDKEAAASVLAEAADQLWSDNAARSTKWLRKAWEQTKSVSSVPKNDGLKEFFTASSQSQLRVRILAITRKHDPMLAEEFLRQMSEMESKDTVKKRAAFDDRTDRSEQLLSLAQLVVETNPQEAFTLASLSLADGISFKLQNILTGIRKKDVELANRLFDLALVRFRSRVPDASEAQVLAGYLFLPGFTFAASSSGQRILAVNSAQQASPPVAPSEPQRAKNFLTAVYELLLIPPVLQDSEAGRVRAQNIVILTDRLMQPFQNYAPELFQSARNLLAQMRGRSTSESVSETAARTPNSADASSTKRFTEEEMYERRIGQLEEIGEKEANDNFKKVAYLRAAMATKPADYIRAKAILDKIADNEFRADATSFFYYRAAMFFLQQSYIEKAIEIGSNITDPRRRAVVNITISQKLLMSLTTKEHDPSDSLIKQRAFEFLVESGRELRKATPSVSIAKIMLGRVAVLSQLDREESLLALQDAVQIINKVEGFDLRDAAAPELGLSALPSSGATVDRPRVGFALRDAVDGLVAKDFEELTSILGRFTTKELSGSARVQVAGLYLQKSWAQVFKNPSPVQ